MAQSTKDTKLVPVYLPFTSLRSTVQSLREHGLPSEIDKSAFGTRSWGAQLLSAFRFLGLIDKEHNTQPILKRLYDSKQDTEEEKQIYKEILETSYSRVFSAVDLQNGTPQQLSDAIGAYGGTSGATRDRSVRFFIKIAEYCGIPLSGHLTRGTRMREESASGTPSKSNGQNAAPKAKRKKRQTPAAEQPAISNPGSAMKTISLPRVGGTLTLSGTFNAFELMGEERDLIYQIIDKMNDYEQKIKTGTKDE